MAAKRKISIRKILQVFLTLVVTICCVTAMISASRIEGEKTLKRVVVHYSNAKKYHSVEEKEILDLAINDRHIDIYHTPMAKLDIRSMEQLIMANPWVARAQVFVDNERVLHMYVTQRIPVVRIFQQDGSSFYLDTTMSIMPLSGKYVYYTSVVTNVPGRTNDSVSWAMRKDILAMVRAIQADTFWSAQVSQVILDSAGMFELVPVLGDHRILFGDATRINEKLHNLFVFYKNVLNRIGWDKYTTLDVRFSNQVVAAPSLPYTGPVDKVVNNMNWINSIVQTEAARDSLSAQQENKSTAPARPVVTPAPKPAAKPAAKQVVHAMPKKTAKPPAKGLKQDKQKDKKQVGSATKAKKQLKPKYVYPDNKAH